MARIPQLWSGRSLERAVSFLLPSPHGSELLPQVRLSCSRSSREEVYCWRCSLRSWVTLLLTINSNRKPRESCIWKNSEKQPRLNTMWVANWSLDCQKGDNAWVHASSGPFAQLRTIFASIPYGNPEVRKSGLLLQCMHHLNWEISRAGSFLAGSSMGWLRSCGLQAGRFASFSNEWPSPLHVVGRRQTPAKLNCLLEMHKAWCTVWLYLITVVEEKNRAWTSPAAGASSFSA